MVDIFNNSFFESAKERAGVLLAKKDLQKERGSKRKTDHEIFEDFQHNLYHPFMACVMADASECEKEGKAYVVHKRITILTSNENSDAFFLYYNNGNTWRQSGNALIGKFLDEYFPDLQMPGMKLGCKGVQELLDAYPDHFDELREKLRERADQGEEKEEEYDDERDPLEETDQP